MRAIVAVNGKCTLVEREIPIPGPDEVLIKVEASGVNRPDILQKKGLYPPPKAASDILGLEVAGTTPEGERVLALLNGGGYAEYAISPRSLCRSIPDEMSFEEAAAIPEAAATAYANLFLLAKLQPEESVLIHGGTGGVGSHAIQLCQGRKIFSTTNHLDKVPYLKSLGATDVFSIDDYVEAIRKLGGVDVILSMLGGPFVEKNLQCLKTGGRLVQIAFLEGTKVEVDLMRLMLKRLQITGSVLRSRSVEEKAMIMEGIQLIAPKNVHVFPLEKAEDAHSFMESRMHLGKIVLKT